MKKLSASIIVLLIFGLFFSIAAVAEETAEKSKLSSPKAAVREFMRIMNKVVNEKSPRINEALATLYLDDVPPANREAVGAQLAAKLYHVLNSFTFKIDALPEHLDARQFVLPIGKTKGIEIALRRYEAGEWKFNYTKTLSKLDAYAEIIKKETDLMPKDETIDTKYFSPRETMRLFFMNMGKETDEGISEASNCFDQKAFKPAIREEMSKERAVMLNSVLSRHRYIDLVELPNTPKAAPIVLLDYENRRVILERTKNADSALESWKFSAQTSKDLPYLYDAFKGKELITGIKHIVDVPLSLRVRDYMTSNFPNLMKKSFALENWQWLGIFCIVFIGVLLGRVVIFLLTYFIKVVFHRENVIVDFETHKRFMKPINIASTTFFWWSGFSLLGLPSEVRIVILVGVKVVSVFASVWAGYRLIDVIGNYLMGKAQQTASKFDDLLVPLVTRAMKAMVVIVGLVFIADVFAIDIDKIMAGLGIGGLAFALAAKDTISNIFGSLTILVDRPFQIGDWVTIGSADGTVESVGARSTRIRTFYDSLITIPNSELINAQIDNYGARTFRRINTTVGISYDTPPEKIDAFCEGIRELIRKHPCTRKDYFIVNLTDFAPCSLGILVYCFVKTEDWVGELREKHRLFADIIRLAHSLGVSFAFPTYTVYNRNDKAPSYHNVPTDAFAAFAQGRTAANQIVDSAKLSEQKHGIKPSLS